MNGDARKRSPNEDKDTTLSLPAPNPPTAGVGAAHSLPEQIGRYKLLSLLGRGGMGAVYLALDPELNRRVAIKLLPSATARKPTARQRFLREAQAIAALNHPGICTIHSIEQDADILFLVLEYVEGNSFRDLLDANATGWPPIKVAEFMLQAAQALEAAHAAGIIHRDIKCSNLMLTPAGRVKILDFGLAKVSHARFITEAGSTIGTPAYWSPEQARGELLDSRTDLWSLGAAFYEVLTGLLPFEGDNVAALTWAITNLAPEPLAQARPDVPAPLARIIHKLLEKNRDLRYVSAAALAEDLQGFLQSPEQRAGGRAPGRRPSRPPALSSIDLLCGAERRPVTFLSIDLAAATATRDPEDFEAALEKSRAMCAKIIAQYDGYLQPWSGGSSAACFGYPRGREDAARLAVQAGLALAEAFSRARAEFFIRAGVDTSLALTDSSEFRLIGGEGFEIARTICQRSGPNEVLVGAETLRIVEGRFALAKEQHLDLPGGRTLSFARVLHASTARSRFESVEKGDLTPLVGRDQELELLTRRWQSAAAGNGHVALIGGAAGLGKSRLVYEVKRRVASDPSAALIESFCAPQYANTMLYPVIECFDRLVFESDTRPMEPGEKLRALEGTLAQLGFPLAETVPLFAQLLSVPAPGYPKLGMTPEAQRARTLDALVHIVIERAGRQPLLFIVEDLHWADPTTLEMLSMLLEQAPAARMLALFTHRLEFHPPWSPRSYVSNLSLDRLRREDAISIASAAARGAQLNAFTLEQIVGNSDGVPLFVEEITKMVAKSGGDHGRAIPVPATLRDSFIARLDQLGNARNIARMASILGRDFPRELLSILSELPDEELDEGLQKLVDAEILYTRGTGSRRSYVFKHALLQEAARDSLLRKTRLALHERVAELLLGRFPESAERQPELVAGHFTEAGLAVRAIPWWHRAGVAALQRSAYREALSHFQSGMDTLFGLPADQRDPSHELLLLASQGTALTATHGFGSDEVGNTYQRALVLLPSAGESNLALPTLWGVWVYNLVRSRLDDARAISFRIIELGERHNSRSIQLEGHWTAGNTLFWAGRLEESRQHLEAAEKFYDPERPEDEAYRFGQDTLVGALCYQSFVFCFQGLFDRALEVSDRSISFARQLRHPFSIGWTLPFRATLECFLGNFAAGRDWGEQAVRFCEEQAYPFWSSAALSALGRSLAELGDVESGIARLREGVTRSRQIGSRVIEPLFQGLLAEALLRSGDAASALAQVDSALEQAREQGVGISVLDLLRVRGLALAALGRTAEARESLEQALAESRAAHCSYVELLAASGIAELSGDLAPLEQICRTFDDAKFEPPVLRRAREILRTQKVK
jgi:tetratricopeptide (TPR) repeat protein/class 3 adenylate cyclase